MYFKAGTAGTIAASLLLARQATAAATWPFPWDELEDLMFLNTGYRARAFSAAVVPCGSSRAGPGRDASAEWLRTAFHDMATGSAIGVNAGNGGLDGSLAFEINTKFTEDIGAAFNTTLTTFSPFMTSQSSLADLISLGVYTSVRACKGPAVGIRTGRIDATAAGLTGVPQPANSISSFQNQFSRMGFTNTQMIQLVACGHTMGGVHSVNFPTIVPPGTQPDGNQLFDSTPAFDSNIAIEYIANNGSDALVKGPCAAVKSCSDFVVFSSDGNATISAMRSPAAFSNTCASVLQQMIDLVPAGVSLTTPISVYDVKPVYLQLSVADAAGSFLKFTGEIRVRTTSGGVSGVQLTYLDRNGASSCGSCTIATVFAGTAAGFDDSFAFFGFSAQLPVTSSISSFVAVVTYTNGSIITFDNNRSGGYPVQDSIMWQPAQSCLTSAGNGNLNMTVTAAVRNSVPTPSVKLMVTVPTPRPSPVPIPELITSTVAMSAVGSAGAYTLYSASFVFGAAQVAGVKFGVVLSGTAFADAFKNTTLLSSTCASLGPPSGPLTTSTSTTATTTTSSPTVRSSTTSTTVTSASGSPSATYLGCMTDSPSARVLTSKQTSSGSLTRESCAAFCAGYPYYGVEYADECYCGTGFTNPTSAAAASDCNMACAGNSAEICGGPNRLNMWHNPVGASQEIPVIPGYTYFGCVTDSVNKRTLTGPSLFSGNQGGMTNEICASFCSGYSYFGTEYASECYCGNTLSATINPDSQCDMLCSGGSVEYCGAGNRLTAYMRS